MGRWEERYVSVIVDGGFTQFFDRFLDATAVSELVIVTPWVTDSGQVRPLLESVVRKIQRENIKATLIVRNPRKEPVNYTALNLLSSAPSLSVWYNDELHAKVYACHCDPHGFAYVGSANLTGRGSTAFEVGLMVEGKGEGKRVVDELARIGNEDLLNRAGTYKGDEQ